MALFLFEYLRNIRTVGAVAPSSPFLARKMVSGIDFAHAKVIVEYGPGTGSFTAEIIRRLQPGTTLLCIESNKAFYDVLNKKYGGKKSVIIVHDGAENVTKILSRYKLDKPDYVVSGLPFTALPADVSHAILQTTARLLGKKGIFITFQYTLLKRGLISSFFDDIDISREFRNIPPAYVLTCRSTSP